MDAEAALNIKELQENWENINLTRPTGFKEETKNTKYTPFKGELWVETQTNNTKLQWLADTGSHAQL